MGQVHDRYILRGGLEGGERLRVLARHDVRNDGRSL